MQTITVDELQVRLSEVAERAERGEMFVITRGDVRLGHLGPNVQKPLPANYRLGLLEGRVVIPENWKDLGRAEIEEDFYGA